MDKNIVIRNIDRLTEILDIRNKLYNALSQVFDIDWGEAWYDDIFTNPYSMVWDMIIGSRGFDELDGEFDDFTDVIWDLVENKKYPCDGYVISNASDVYNYFTHKKSTN